jgi:hypothetical protein
VTSFSTTSGAARLARRRAGCERSLALASSPAPLPTSLPILKATLANRVERTTDVR